MTTSFNVATALLMITGSAADNHVIVTGSATHEGYVVFATDGVSGATSFTGVVRIALDLQGQASATGDTLDLVGGPGTNSFLSGGLRSPGPAG